MNLISLEASFYANYLITDFSSKLKDEKIHECGFCKRTFKQAAHLKYHLHSHLKQFDKFESDLKELVTKNVSNGLGSSSNDLKNNNNKSENNDNGEKNHDEEYQLESGDDIKIENSENLMISTSSSNEEIYHDDHESDFADEEEEEDDEEDEEEEDEDEEEDDDDDEERADRDFEQNGKTHAEEHNDDLNVTNDCENSNSFNEEEEIDRNGEHAKNKDD